MFDFEKVEGKTRCRVPLMEIKIHLKKNSLNMQQDGEDRGGRPEERDGEGAVQDQLLPGSVADPDPDLNPSDPYVFGTDPDSLVKGIDLNPDPDPFSPSKK